MFAAASLLARPDVLVDVYDRSPAPFGLGRGQVVDAAIVDGTSHLLVATHSMLGAGRWADRRGENLLDGGAPFYSVYETADGGHVAVGAIEPGFYAELLRLLGVDPADAAPGEQYDRERWPDLRRTLPGAFARRTRDEWAEHFAGTDACVAPVLGLREAARHPHLAYRGTLRRRTGCCSRASRPASPDTVPGLPPGRPYRDSTPGRSCARSERTRTD